MTQYIISYTKPHNHYVDVEFIAGGIDADETLIQLPAWRPGRYELGNFAKNIQRWQAFDEKGNALFFEKIKKDCWKVQTKGVKQIHIKYNYYAAELNAGSTYLDNTQLYMNPVNCCVYIPERINESCELQLLLPNDYNVAIGLIEPQSQKIKTPHSFVFDDFHELADSPFIASNSLKNQQFENNGVTFYVWLQGECTPNWNIIIRDFKKFVQEQMLMMKAFPAKSYHFLFQILPYRAYHGVEHVTSTVITLGPGYNLMKGSLYEDLLGVSSHELFHAWNIKTIRPAEMLPYDYSQENYSRLGYVSEGVTTYYGDSLLYRSGVFTTEQYLKTFAERLQKHVDNFGRFNLSVAESSFDTWLDGYTKGVANRKTSIYDEGCLLAFITDMFIRKHSNNKHSLDDVMVHLYQEFALKQKGYTEKDYKGIIEYYANNSFDEVFDNYINNASDYQPALLDAMDYIGCELIMNATSQQHEHCLGIKVSEIGGICKVNAVYPHSIADNAGIAINDEILAVNGIQLKPEGNNTNFTEWCNYFIANNNTIRLSLASSRMMNEVELKPLPNSYYKVVSMQKQKQANSIQKANFELWSKNKF
jgi:predicted metalloprotease with PDZ domain